MSISNQLQGYGVIDNDIWKQPGLAGDIVAFGLAEAKRAADEVPGGAFAPPRRC